MSNTAVRHDYEKAPEAGSVVGDHFVLSPQATAKLSLRSSSCASGGPSLASLILEALVGACKEHEFALEPRSS